MTVLLCLRKKNNLIAKIYRENELVETIDLTKENSNRELVIEGYKSEMTIEVKKNAIRVKQSGCPHQDCVNIGWVNTSNHPIICTYNKVSIDVISNNSNYDIEVG